MFNFILKNEYLRSSFNGGMPHFPYVLGNWRTGVYCRELTRRIRRIVLCSMQPAAGEGCNITQCHTILGISSKSN